MDSIVYQMLGTKKNCPVKRKNAWILSYIVVLGTITVRKTCIEKPHAFQKVSVCVISNYDDVSTQHFVLLQITAL